ncbi:hypothetical protein BC628DRAFT_1327653 [Trametes gibbosa]|nr:hypothetical protein BC628DRAFT_1327653 [Trametes gibbosa]
MSSRPPPSSASKSTPSAPKTAHLRPKSLLSLPHRLTHPPPPHPKESSWGITPHFRIPLDEILDRKHLPPLGLKDFEEWLLFIDRAPENLYFILWLREYTVRYSAWARQSRAPPPSRPSSSQQARAYRSLSAPHPPPNPTLALFYLRAKETFLTLNGPYALRLPQDVLAPFQSSSLGAGVGGPSGGSWPHAFASHQSDSLLGSPPPPPDPAVFAEVADGVRAVLSDSLDRFVVATFHNVGMPRAYCGCAGGTVIGLTGSAPILLANFLTGGSRWWRFTAIPGMWLGLTIVLSAMYGVCMMIYVFGDLRQLRSFELARFPDTESPKMRPEGAKQKQKMSIRMFNKSDQHANPSDSFVPSSQALTGPPPPLVQNEASVCHSVAAHSPSEMTQCRVSRPSLSKLRIAPPQPALVHTPIRTSYCTYPDLARVQSVSSTSHSVRSGKRSIRQPCFAPVSDQEYDTEDGSGSDYESDDSSSSVETDASSHASHHSVTDEGVSMNVQVKPESRRRRRRTQRTQEPEIHISDAFFDEHPCPEGPATADPQERTGRTSVWGDSSEEDVGTGATFIHAFHWDEEIQMCSHDIESQAHCAAEHQRIDSFDFDGLPLPRRSSRADVVPLAPSPMVSNHVALPPVAPVPLAAESEKPTRVHFADADANLERSAARSTPLQEDAHSTRLCKFIAFIQEKCGPRNVVMQGLGSHTSTPTFAEKERLPELRWSAPSGPFSPTSTLSPPSPTWPTPSTHVPGSPTSSITMTTSSTLVGVGCAKSKPSWQVRVRRMLQVPAFASPLTPVLNPVVTRGQWEIVVRSALIALVTSVTVVGALVAIPETSVVR